MSDSDVTLADPAEDITGRSVIDADGEEIGSVDDLMIDDVENKVRFIRVASGNLLDVGKTKFVIPVDAVTRITGDTVHIDRNRDQVAAAPAYNAGAVDKDYFARLYHYYGYNPYWSAGYAYPAFPYYS